MNPAARALWYIESHSSSDLSLADIADAACVSRFHLARAFEAATGIPVMRYLRTRRLSRAAHRLATGAPDILAVALEAGYNSHEAFTRAFREQFNTTPEKVRAQGHVANISLMEPLPMPQTPLADLETPRYETSKPLQIGGLNQHYTCETSAAIPEQWQRFAPHLPLPGQVGSVAYGVCHNGNHNGDFDYLCGVVVAANAKLPDGMSVVSIPERRYAVFAHRDHVSAIRRTFSAIWNDWLPGSGFKLANAPNLERYGEDFNPATGRGSIEIWIPVEE